MDYRVCVKCKIPKPASSDFFYRDKNRYLGLMYRCIECDKKKIDKRTSSERRARMSEHQLLKLKEIRKRYQVSEKGKAISLLAAYQKSDFKKGFQNDLTQNDILLAKKSTCIYCGFPASGYDRISNEKGHTKDNVVPCCRDCNTARMDNFTHEEMKIIGAAIKTVKLNRTIIPEPIKKIPK
jgi:ssDNA-binding Zn-finger/Zn-ribbon topoisomerase 1